MGSTYLLDLVAFGSFYVNVEVLAVRAAAFR